jgi:hypothetical protein
MTVRRSLVIATLPASAARSTWRRAQAGLGAFLLVLAFSPRALAEPDWVTDFKAKAKGWEDRANAALDRLEAAAKAAEAKLDQAMKERADELERVLNEDRDALEAVLAQQDAAWAAVVAKRFEQVTKTAEALSHDLDAIAAGTGRVVTAESARLTVGLRSSVTEGLRQANVQLGEARLVDERVVADAVAGTTSSITRWAFILVVVVGALILLVGAPLAYRHDRLLALAFAVLGVAIAGFGGYKLREPDGAAETVALGLTECPALAEAHDFLVQHAAGLAPAARPTARALRLHLARCQALAADDVLAQLAAVELQRLHQLTGGR